MLNIEFNEEELSKILGEKLANEISRNAEEVILLRKEQEISAVKQEINEVNEFDYYKVREYFKNCINQNKHPNILTYINLNYDELKDKYIELLHRGISLENLDEAIQQIMNERYYEFEKNYREEKEEVGEE